MNSLVSSILNSMSTNKTDDGYSTGVGLPTGYAGQQGTEPRKAMDMIALKELYRQAIMNGDDEKVAQIEQMITQMTGGQNAPQGNPQGY